MCPVPRPPQNELATHAEHCKTILERTESALERNQVPAAEDLNDLFAARRLLYNKEGCLDLVQRCRMVQFIHCLVQDGFRFDQINSSIRKSLDGLTKRVSLAQIFASCAVVTEQRDTMGNDFTCFRLPTLLSKAFEASARPGDEPLNASAGCQILLSYIVCRLFYQTGKYNDDYEMFLDDVTDTPLGPSYSREGMFLFLIDMYESARQPNWLSFEFIADHVLGKPRHNCGGVFSTIASATGFHFMTVAAYYVRTLIQAPDDEDEAIVYACCREMLNTLRSASLYHGSPEMQCLFDDEVARQDSAVELSRDLSFLQPVFPMEESMSLFVQEGNYTAAVGLLNEIIGSEYVTDVEKEGTVALFFQSLLYFGRLLYCKNRHYMEGLPFVLQHISEHYRKLLMDLLVGFANSLEGLADVPPDMKEFIQLRCRQTILEILQCRHGLGNVGDWPEGCKEFVSPSLVLHSSFKSWEEDFLSQQVSVPDSSRFGGNVDAYIHKLFIRTMAPDGGKTSNMDVEHIMEDESEDEFVDAIEDEDGFVKAADEAYEVAQEAYEAAEGAHEAIEVDDDDDAEIEIEDDSSGAIEIVDDSEEEQGGTSSEVSAEEEGQGRTLADDSEQEEAFDSTEEMEVDDVEVLDGSDGDQSSTESEEDIEPTDEYSVRSEAETTEARVEQAERTTISEVQNEADPVSDNLDNRDAYDSGYFGEESQADDEEDDERHAEPGNSVEDERSALLGLHRIRGAALGVPKRVREAQPRHDDGYDPEPSDSQDHDDVEVPSTRIVDNRKAADLGPAPPNHDEGYDPEPSDSHEHEEVEPYVIDNTSAVLGVGGEHDHAGEQVSAPVRRPDVLDDGYQGGESYGHEDVDKVPKQCNLSGYEPDQSQCEATEESEVSEAAEDENDREDENLEMVHIPLENGHCGNLSQCIAGSQSDVHADDEGTAFESEVDGPLRNFQNDGADTESGSESSLEDAHDPHKPTFSSGTVAGSLAEIAAHFQNPQVLTGVGSQQRPSVDCSSEPEDQETIVGRTEAGIVAAQDVCTTQVAETNAHGEILQIRSEVDADESHLSHCDASETMDVGSRRDDAEQSGSGKAGVVGKIAPAEENAGIINDNETESQGNSPMEVEKHDFTRCQVQCSDDFGATEQGTETETTLGIRDESLEGEKNENEEEVYQHEERDIDEKVQSTDDRVSIDHKDINMEVDAEPGTSTLEKSNVADNLGTTAEDESTVESRTGEHTHGETEAKGAVSEVDTETSTTEKAQCIENHGATEEQEDTVEIDDESPTIENANGGVEDEIFMDVEGESQSTDEYVSAAEEENSAVEADIDQSAIEKIQSVHGSGATAANETTNGFDKPNINYQDQRTDDHGSAEEKDISVGVEPSTVEDGQSADDAKDSTMAVDVGSSPEEPKMKDVLGTTEENETNVEDESSILKKTHGSTEDNSVAIEVDDEAIATERQFMEGHGATEEDKVNVELDDKSCALENTRNAAGAEDAILDADSESDIIEKTPTGDDVSVEGSGNKKIVDQVEDSVDRGSDEEKDAAADIEPTTTEVAQSIVDRSTTEEITRSVSTVAAEASSAHKGLFPDDPVAKEIQENTKRFGLQPSPTKKAQFVDDRPTPDASDPSVDGISRVDAEANEAKVDKAQPPSVDVHDTGKDIDYNNDVASEERSEKAELVDDAIAVLADGSATGAASQSDDMEEHAPNLNMAQSVDDHVIHAKSSQSADVHDTGEDTDNNNDVASHVRSEKAELVDDVIAVLADGSVTGSASQNDDAEEQAPNLDKAQSVSQPNSSQSVDVHDTGKDPDDNGDGASRERTEDAEPGDDAIAVLAEGSASGAASQNDDVEEEAPSLPLDKRDPVESATGTENSDGPSNSPAASEIDHKSPAASGIGYHPSLAPNSPPTTNRNLSLPGFSSPRSDPGVERLKESSERHKRKLEEQIPDAVGCVDMDDEISLSSTISGSTKDERSISQHTPPSKRRKAEARSVPRSGALETIDEAKVAPTTPLDATPLRRSQRSAARSATSSQSSVARRSRRSDSTTPKSKTSRDTRASSKSDAKREPSSEVQSTPPQDCPPQIPKSTENDGDSVSVLDATPKSKNSRETRASSRTSTRSHSSSARTGESRSSVRGLPPKPPKRDDESTCSSTGTRRSLRKRKNDSEGLDAGDRANLDSPAKRTKKEDDKSDSDTPAHLATTPQSGHRRSRRNSGTKSQAPKDESPPEKRAAGRRSRSDSVASVDSTSSTGTRRSARLRKT